jgi:Domain of unknown function (DUF4214)
MSMSSLAGRFCVPGAHVRFSLFLITFFLLAGAFVPARANYPPLRTITASTTWQYPQQSLHFSVADPLRNNQTMQYDTPYVNALNYSVVDGVVQWSEQTYGPFGTSVFTNIHFAVYDPQFGMWKEGQSGYGGHIAVINKDGVVEWSERNTDASGHTTIKIHYATYDPQRGAWIFGEGFAGDQRNVISSGGVIEWTTFTPDAFNTTYYVTVNFAIYDPVRGDWREGSAPQFILSGQLTVNVTNFTVTWSSTNNSGTRGYDPATGNWFAGTTKPLAQFSYATISSSVPKPVLFWDMSLASTSWSYAFGDGGGTGVRSPLYTYNAAGYYNVTQFVNGPGGSHQTTKPILIGISNRIDDADQFVRQQYLDFLNREPDSGGWAYWASFIKNCGTNQTCIQSERIHVSRAFYESIEFQNTGYLVYRFYKASFGRQPRFSEFLADSTTIGRGVVVGQPGWDTTLENNKVAFANAWVGRSAFANMYNSMSNEQYVDTLFANAGVTPSQSERDALVNGLYWQTETRATVVRKVAENSQLFVQEYNPAFVLFEYFGYLRRNPDDPPDGNMGGYNFWLTTLNNSGAYPNSNYNHNIDAFIKSTEYRKRFGQP